MNFSNRTAIVTGGTRGIGKSVAELLCKNGCYTIITGTKPKNKYDLGDKGLHYIRLDFQNQNTLTKFFKEINSFKNIDILVNNAGINIIEPVFAVTLGNWEKVLKVNLTGPLILMKEISKIMKRQRHGRIVNVSSIFGMVSREKRNVYSASKTGLIGLTRAASLDLAPHNVLVNAICPGFTKTELTFSILSPKERKVLSKDIPLGRFAEVEEIAKTVLFLCSDLNTYITGQTIVIDGGYTIK
jgi:3-oxoacyl-[acyl-carrier protein] reductase